MAMILSLQGKPDRKFRAKMGPSIADLLLIYKSYPNDKNNQFHL
jgi:hypothetical protein